MKVSFDLFDIDDMKQFLYKYEDVLDKKCDLYVRRLCAEGIEVIDRRYSSASLFGYNAEHETYVLVESYDKGIMSTLVCRGEQICFIEFGAGIYYNGGESMVGQPTSEKARELNMNIAEYDGQHYSFGQYPMWRKPDGTITNGIPALAPMQSADAEIIAKYHQIAMEVFKYDE